MKSAYITVIWDAMVLTLLSSWVQVDSWPIQPEISSSEMAAGRIQGAF
jgi:hypothetical protein